MCQRAGRGAVVNAVVCDVVMGRSGIAMEGDRIGVMVIIAAGGSGGRPTSLDKFGGRGLSNQVKLSFEGARVG